ncbi:MAG TPA: ankyrin repeat domain-containing protein [Alphaproteobacteria bacterium]|nr:ankyrin repeat domain-containing protein [Alphaproteobacteria bacterium]
MTQATQKPASVTSLTEAIDQGATIKQIAALLRAGAAVDAPDAQGRRPVDAAIARSLWEVADELIARGAAPPAYDGDPNGPPQLSFCPPEYKGETALTYMVKRATSFSYVYNVIANGADVNLKNQKGETPLFAVVNRGWPYAAVELVKRGAWIDPENPDHDEVIDKKTGSTRLLCTILQGKDAAAVEQMLNQGANPNKTDFNGLSPLAAARALKWDYVENLLLDYGAKPQSGTLPNPDVYVGKDKDLPLLVYAASYQGTHANYILSLLEQGADTELADKEGRTAAHWAAIFNNVWLIGHLAARGADMNRPYAEGSLRPLHFACMNGAYEAVDALMDYAACEHINEKVGPQKETALHLAAGRKGAADTVRLLIELGADVNATDARSRTPLLRAIDARDLDTVRVLIRSGADVPKMPCETDRNPPLFELVNSHSPENLNIADALIARGADVNAKAPRSFGGPQAGDTLIYFSISYRANELAKILLETGADPHGTNHAGESAAHYCLNLREKRGLEILLAHGFDPQRRFAFTKTWTGSDGTRIEEHNTSALECARALTEKFGADSEYGAMLKTIENHIAATQAPVPAPTAAAKRVKGQKPQF